MKAEAGDLVAMLAKRHERDVFVPECNAGSAHAGCRRLDAWALLKTWSPFTVIGYETKVARGDFLGDRKWVDYLPVCHEFYFVCPARLIAVEELPEHVGLLWTAGSRLLTKRKAVRREPDPVELSRLMAYVLMSRSRIVGDMWEANKGEAVSYWRTWLADKAEKQTVGRASSKRLQEIVREHAGARQKAEREAQRLQAIAARLDALGLPEGTREYEIQRLLGVKQEEPARLARIRQLARSIEEVASA